jgi:hypothetical protein
VAKSHGKNKGRNDKGTHLGLPHVVTNCPDFRQLSPTAFKVLIMVANQYNGFNNGDLQATFNLAKEWGIGSQQTLSKAIKELLEVNLIMKTREGMFQNPGRKCSLYAITWQKIDECKGKLDVSPTTTPPRKFSIEQNKIPSPKSVATRYGKCSDDGQEIDQETIYGYKNCSHANVFSLPVTTKNGDLYNLPGGLDQLRIGDQRQ